MGFLVFGAAQPLYSLPFIAFTYTLWLNAFIYEATRRMVVRMDILPHLEMVSFQKVGPFGSVYNKLVKITDLEKLDYNQEKEKGTQILF